MAKKPIQALLMNCDNRTVIIKVKISKQNLKSSKDVKRRLNSVKKMKNSGVIALDYVKTAKNLTDPFTKRVSRNMIDLASMELGLRPTRELPRGNPTYVIIDHVNEDLGKQTGAAKLR
jgi:hypothetical protein